MNAETSSTEDQVRSIAVKQLRSGTELMATKNCNGVSGVQIIFFVSNLTRSGL